MTTSTWVQPSMPLTSSEADDLDDINNHLIDCLCDECMENVIIMMHEERQAS